MDAAISIKCLLIDAYDSNRIRSAAALHLLLEQSVSSSDKFQLEVCVIPFKIFALIFIVFSRGQCNEHYWNLETLVKLNNWCQVQTYAN